MASGLIEIMQLAARGVMDSAKLCDVVIGTVTKQDPYEIRIESKLTLKQADGVLTFSRNVTDYETEVTPIEWETKVGGSEDPHTHGIADKKKITIHNKLKVGDKAVMLRLAGGQHYLVLDKVGEL